MRDLRSFLQLLLFFALATVVSTSSLRAQCSGEEVSINDFFDEALQAVAVKEGAAKPLEAPPSQQITAPSDSSASTLVNGVGFPNLLALATETGLVSDKDGVLTLDLNLFAARAALAPEVIYRQSLYKKYDNMRRFGGSISFGGKG